MALIVETGSIVGGAESYVSVADCDTYHANRGNSAWTGTDTVKEAALRKATAFLDGKYRLRWKGVKLSSLQALSWPRSGVTDESGYTILFNTIPQRLKDAVCEAALRSLSADLAADVEPGIKRQKVDVIETEYFGGAGVIQYQVIDQLLADLIRGGNDLVRG